MTPARLERQRARQRRRHATRPKVENLRRLTVIQRRNLAEEAGATDHARPKTRGECSALERPCPFVGCRHHLFLDVTSAGNILFNFPHLEPEELVESCALDVADSGGRSLEDVGGLMNISRERVRQIEVDARNRIIAALEEDEEHDDDE